MTFFLHGSLIPRLRCLCRPSGPEIRVLKKNKEKQKLAPMLSHTMLKLYRETGFEAVPILNELDLAGGEEGDVQLFVYDRTDVTDDWFM